MRRHERHEYKTKVSNIEEINEQVAELRQHINTPLF